MPTPIPQPLVSIVVLSWNKLEETKPCVETLRKLSYPNYEIVVVDNGSADGSKEWLAKQADITYVDLPTNTGFTGGQIAGLAAARGKFLALVNNDAAVAPDWLDRLMEQMDDSQVAVVGGRAYLWNDDYPAYDNGNPFYSYQVVDMVRGYAQTLQVGDEVVSVNSISGAGVLIRREAIEKVGYFDDRFFAYYEESDLFARMKRAGYKVLYTPYAKTWHKIAQSTKDKPYFYLYQMHRNRFIYAYKNFDSEYLPGLLKHYFGQGLRAWIKWLMGAHDDDTLARTRAAFWNLWHIVPTWLARSRVLKLGPTYSKLLPKDACQTVSVVIPCYNYADHVSEAIESALNQTQPPLEVIVLNDGSTDNSLVVIKRYEGQIRIVDKSNSGVIDTKNLGLTKAKGDWVVFLDADDHLELSYIEETLRLAREHNYDVVYTDMQYFGAKQGLFRARPYSRFYLCRYNYINNSALIRTELMRRVGGYKEQMKGGYEDWELYLSLAETGMQAGWLPKPLLYYRQHAQASRNTMSREDDERVRKVVYTLHPALFKSNSIVGVFFFAKSVYRRLAPLRRFLNLMDRFFLTRKAKGLAKLILRGRWHEIGPKLKKHWRKLRANDHDWKHD